jgi:hypothetical protein
VGRAAGAGLPARWETGVGIPKEVGEKVFERLVEAHGGRI